jgi:hypothetical protein
VRRMTAPESGGSPFDRWVAAHSDLLRVAGITIAVVVLFFTGLVLVPVIVIAALLALYLWAVSVSTGRVAAAGADTVEAVVDQSNEAPTP